MTEIAIKVIKYCSVVIYLYGLKCLKKEAEVQKAINEVRAKVEALQSAHESNSEVSSIFVTLREFDSCSDSL